MRRIIRPRPGRWAAAVVSVTALAWLVSSGPGGLAATTPHGHRAALTPPAGRPAAHPAAASVSSPSDTGAISATAATTQQAGPDGADLATTVTITNTSAATVAFLLRADVRRGTASGGLLAGDNELQSSIWQDNDITLFPGESQTLTVTYDSSDLGANTPVITVSGWNVPQVNIPAPVP
jgi:hypothetical protein